MARMIYTKQPSVRLERSESMVFNALKNDDHTRNWTVFYSLKVSNPGREPREIDFLIIIPEYFCIICLEVKGGSYGIKQDGRWYNDSNDETLEKSPHDQASSAMFALKNDCGRKGLKGFGRIEYLSLGCAVALTDMSKPPSDLPEHLAHSIWSNDVQDRNRLRERLIGLTQ